MPERVSAESEFSEPALRFHDAVTSRARLIVVKTIAKHPGITVNQLNEALELSQPAISLSLKHLRELGYIQSQKSTEDGRVSHLFVNRSKLGTDFAHLFLELLP